MVSIRAKYLQLTVLRFCIRLLNAIADVFEEEEDDANSAPVVVLETTVGDARLNEPAPPSNQQDSAQASSSSPSFGMPFTAAPAPLPHNGCECDLVYATAFNLRSNNSDRRFHKVHTCLGLTKASEVRAIYICSAQAHGLTSCKVCS